MRRVISGLDAPNLANIIPGGKTPMLTAKELEGIGYAVVVYPTVNTYVIAKAAAGLFTQLYQTGTLAGLEDRMFEFEEFNALVELPEIRAREQEYLRKV